MIRLRSTDVKQITTLHKHPWYQKDTHTFTVMFNGEPRDDVVVADTINGFIKIYGDNQSLRKVGPVHAKRVELRLIRMKGKVEIFKRVDGPNE